MLSGTWWTLMRYIVKKYLQPSAMLIHDFSSFLFNPNLVCCLLGASRHLLGLFCLKGWKGRLCFLINSFYTCCSCSGSSYMKTKISFALASPLNVFFVWYLMWPSLSVSLCCALQEFFGNYFYRPPETFHVATRKFLEKVGAWMMCATVRCCSCNSAASCLRNGCVLFEFLILWIILDCTVCRLNVK